MRRNYQWTWFYAAVEPATGETFCLYLPGLDKACYGVFLQELTQRYPDDLLVLVQDNAPAHLAKISSYPTTFVCCPYRPTVQN